MKSLGSTNKKIFTRQLFAIIAIYAMTAAFILFPATAKNVEAQSNAPETTSTVFSNPVAIAPADRVSNNAGTNPGVPTTNYPSPITVSGLSGSITKVTVTFAITSTFPDDFDILLVGPTGARSLVMSDAGGSGDITNVSFTFDQTAAATIPDAPTTPLPTGTFQPSNFAGLVTPEPGGQDNFPTAGGLATYPLGFGVFNGTAPNGTWNLYVVDDQVLDTSSLPGGWSLDITTGAPTVAQHIIDFNGDGKSDFGVVRNTGGGPSGQITWFINLNTVGTTYASQWGLAQDFFVPVDYDGDNKTDIAVWRPGAPGVAAFYILNSATNTVKIDNFGQVGDDPTVVDDYDGDGKADPAVYRAAAGAGDQSTWFYRGSLNNPSGNVTYVPWGQIGDFPSPGDYDGDGKADFVVQRSDDGGQAKFWMLQTTAGFDTAIFGTPTDVITPGDYDGDGKTDLAVVRNSAGQINWYVRPSSTGVISGTPYAIFGNSATDLVTHGDYDGDGKTDVGIWRPSATPGATVFWVQGSAGGVFSVPFGANGDYPVANYNRH